MPSFFEKSLKKKIKSTNDSISNKEKVSNQALSYQDNRTSTTLQRNLNEKANTSHQVLQLSSLQEMAATSQKVKTSENNSMVYQLAGKDMSAEFEKKSNRIDQFNSDIEIWYETLFSKDDSMSDQEKLVLDQQQDLLKRNFVAMAAMDLQGLDQETGDYLPLDEKLEKDEYKLDPSQRDLLKYGEPDVPLAALASHGGRVAYESSTKEVGNQFKNQLLFGSDEAEKTEKAHYGKKGIKKALKGSGTRPLEPEKREEGVHAGLYARASSHTQTQDATGKWSEHKAEVGGHEGWFKDTRKVGDYISEGIGGKFANADENSLGMNFPLGGAGNTAKYSENHTEPGSKTPVKKDTEYTIKSEGTMSDAEGNGVIDKHQHGHAYIKHTEAQGKNKEGARTMVGFEGSAPSQASMFGKHDSKSMEKGKGNDRSLTGQDKASKIGLDMGLGSVVATVTQKKMDDLKQLFNGLKILKGAPELEKEIFRELLESKTKEQREAAIDKIRQFALIEQESASSEQVDIL